MSKHFLFIVIVIVANLSFNTSTTKLEFVIFLLSNSREYYFVPAVVSFCSPMIKGNLHGMFNLTTLVDFSKQLFHSLAIGGKLSKFVLIVHYCL